MAWAEGVETEPCSEGGLNVSWIENGDCIKVKGVDFGAGATSFGAPGSAGVPADGGLPGASGSAQGGDAGSRITEDDDDRGCGCRSAPGGNRRWHSLAVGLAAGLA